MMGLVAGAAVLLVAALAIGIAGNTTPSHPASQAGGHGNAPPTTSTTQISPPANPQAAATTIDLQQADVGAGFTAQPAASNGGSGGSGGAGSESDLCNLNAPATAVNASPIYTNSAIPAAAWAVVGEFPSASSAQSFETELDTPAQGSQCVKPIGDQAINKAVAGLGCSVVGSSVVQLPPSGTIGNGVTGFEYTATIGCGGNGNTVSGGTATDYLDILTVTVGTAFIEGLFQSTMAPDVSLERTDMDAMILRASTFLPHSGVHT